MDWLSYTAGISLLTNHWAFWVWFVSVNYVLYWETILNFYNHSRSRAAFLMDRYFPKEEKPFNFLGLPPDLRVMIYRILCQDPIEPYWKPDIDHNRRLVDRARRLPRAHLELLGVNKQLNEEYGREIAVNGRFYFTSAESFNRFMAHVGNTPNRRWLKMRCLELNFSMTDYMAFFGWKYPEVTAEEFAALVPFTNMAQADQDSLFWRIQGERHRWPQTPGGAGFLALMVLHHLTINFRSPAVLDKHLLKSMGYCQGRATAEILQRSWEYLAGQPLQLAGYIRPDVRRAWTAAFDAAWLAKWAERDDWYGSGTPTGDWAPGPRRERRRPVNDEGVGGYINRVVLPEGPDGQPLERQRSPPFFEVPLLVGVVQKQCLCKTVCRRRVAPWTRIDLRGTVAYEQRKLLARGR